MLDVLWDDHGTQELFAHSLVTGPQTALDTVKSMHVLNG